jgi:hypothetical protein
VHAPSVRLATPTDGLWQASRRRRTRPPVRSMPALGRSEGATTCSPGVRCLGWACGPRAKSTRPRTAVLFGWGSWDYSLLCPNREGRRLLFGMQEEARGRYSGQRESGLAGGRRSRRRRRRRNRDLQGSDHWLHPSCVDGLRVGECSRPVLAGPDHWERHLRRVVDR